MKKVVVLVLSLVLLSLMALSIIAVKPAGPAAYNGWEKGKSLELYEKDTDWNIVEKGANGKLSYGDDFVFNGHGLASETEYTLIRYNDPWPGKPIVCLGEGTTNKGGNIHLAGEMLDGGSKVWLVLSNDVDCETGMTGWNPISYLWEYAEI